MLKPTNFGLKLRGAIQIAGTGVACIAATLPYLKTDSVSLNAGGGVRFLRYVCMLA